MITPESFMQAFPLMFGMIAAPIVVLGLFGWFSTMGDNPFMKRLRRVWFGFSLFTLGILYGGLFAHAFAEVMVANFNLPLADVTRAVAKLFIRAPVFALFMLFVFIGLVNAVDFTADNVHRIRVYLRARRIFGTPKLVRAAQG